MPKLAQTRGVRNNNPFNIKHVPSNHWTGLLPNQDGQFCKFSSLQLGIRAGLILIRNYIRKGIDTPRSIVSVFAPSSENNTDAYCQYISTFVPLDTPVQYPSIEYVRLVIGIMQYESMVICTPKYIFNLLNYYRI